MSRVGRTVTPKHFWRERQQATKGEQRIVIKVCAVGKVLADRCVTVVLANSPH